MEFVENGAPIFPLDSDQFTITDEDNIFVLQCTLSIENTPANVTDQLSATPNENFNVTGSGTPNLLIEAIGPNRLITTHDMMVTFLRTVSFSTNDQAPNVVRNLSVLVEEFPLGDAEPAVTFVPIRVLGVNDPPVVGLGVRGVPYVESGGPVQLFPGLSVTDVDGAELASATLVLECLNCPAGDSGQYSARDSIISQSPERPYRLEQVSSDSQRLEFLVMPAVQQDRNISRFTRYLETLHFDNADLEPVTALRQVFLTVSDGFNSSDSISVTVNIQLRDDERPIIGLPYETFTYTENSGLIRLFEPNSSPRITDADGSSLFAATAWLTSVSLDNTSESLAINCSGFDNLRCDSNSSVVSVTGEGSLSEYSQVLGTLAYSNTEEEPDPDVSRTVTLIVSDEAFSSPEATFSIGIRLINDLVPVVSPSLVRVTFTEVNPVSPPVAFASNLTVSDPDRGTFPIHSLRADLTNPLDVGEEGIRLRTNLMFPEYVSIDASDPTSVSILVQENSVNVNGDPVTGLSPMLVRRFLEGLEYENTAEQPSGLNRTVMLVASDNLTLEGVQDSAPAQVVIEFEFVDDLPSVELNMVVLFYSEGEPPLVVAPEAVVVDVDSANISGLAIELLSEFDLPQEVISVSLPPDSSIVVSAVSNEQTILLVGEASVAEYTSVLRQLTYQHTAEMIDRDMAGNRQLIVTPLLDEMEGVSDDLIIVFNITNAPPLLDLNGPGRGRDNAITFVEEGEAINVTSRELILTDMDSANLDFVVITLSGDLDGTSEEIFISGNDQSSITVEQNSTSSIVLFGQPSPVEEFRSLLLLLQYVNRADEPTPGDRNVSIVAVGSGVAEAVSVISIVLVNDAPVLSLNGSQANYRVSYMENGPSVVLTRSPLVSDTDSLLSELRIQPMPGFEGDTISANISLAFNDELGYYFVNLDLATPTEVAELLSTVTYSSSLAEPLPGDRVFCFSVLDQESLPSSGDSCTVVSLGFENDSPPVFNQSLYTGEVQENMGDVSVVTVAATDADSTNSQVELSYAIVSGDDCMPDSMGSGALLEVSPTETVLPCRFAIDSQTGVISTTDTPPDREEKPSYLLAVTVSDGLNEGSAYVNITITDQNDVAPRFEPEFYNVTIPLGADAGFVLANITAVDPDIDDEITIFIDGTEPSVMGVFDGAVFLLIPEEDLDPEIPQYVLTFSAADSASVPNFATNRAIVQVNVILNDADPVFDLPLYNVSVLETAEVGSIIEQVSATDADTGSNAEITYSIQSESFIPFIIDPSTGSIVLASSLDFGTAQFYTFTVIATDAGKIPRSSSASVFVRVMNENLATPTFTQSEYSMSVCEGAAVGYEILTVVAEDSDSGNFGVVTYAIADQGGAQGRVNVNETTGVISVATPLDFEAELPATFVLLVRAVDGGGNYSEARVIISLLNDNEFAPVFQTTVFEVTIPANYPVGSPLPLSDVSESLASDRDGCRVDQCGDGNVPVTNETCSGSNGLTYSIASGNEDNLFSIDPLTGIVILADSLESAEGDFTLSLFVTDGQLNATAQLLVTITPDDVRLPQFEASSYNVTIPENISVGMSILTVAATDIDPTSVILYSLSGEGANDFSINTTSGVISVANMLSFQSVPRYDLVVQARFGGDIVNVSSSAVSLVIYVAPTNENLPVFTEDPYTFSVSENTAPGRIGMVLAMDSDSGLNAEIRYSIASGNLTLFRIDPVTGELFSLAMLDHEDADSRELTVSATDSGLPPRSALAEVVVRVTDVNEPPAFDRNVYPVSVSEDDSVGGVAVTLSASDPDDGQAVLLYEIISGNELGHFMIDNQTGVVYIAAVLDRESLDRYSLGVRVMGSDASQLASTASVVIEVTDVNDNPPIFSEDVYVVSVSENISSLLQPYPLISVLATDTDAQPNNIITYTLVLTADEPFAIDPVTGLVSVSRPADIDRETVDRYYLTVNGSDPGGLSDTAVLVVEVTDINDNSPMFAERVMSASVEEDFTPVVSDDCSEYVPGTEQPEIGSGMEMQVINKYITTLVATDRDEENTTNSKIAYALVSVSPPASFIVDRYTGDVYVAQLLDRECFQTYNLTIEATNPGTSLRDTASLVVTVTDLNDNAPAFSTSMPNAVNVSEDIPMESEVIRAMAEDPDSGTNALLVYSLGPDSSPFAIDSSSGVIFTTATLDRENVSFYKFDVLVSDSGDPSFSATTSLEITVLDVNDNPPVLSPSIVELNLNESYPVGSIVVNFTVTDLDEGSNAEFELRIPNRISSFAIEDQNLVVSGVLDFETMAEFQFIVLAENVGRTDLFSSATVSITLNNLNDNPPIVVLPDDPVTYFERNKQLVLDVNAVITDEDGVNITTLVDGIVEFLDANPREPSIPFTPNTDDRYLPYDCPLEDVKDTKFPPCNLAVLQDHVFTRPAPGFMLRNNDFDPNCEFEQVSDTFILDASCNQYAYRTVASILGKSGLTISTWVWFDPVGEEEGSSPSTIVSKASNLNLLYSVFCLANNQDLGFQYRDQTGEQEVVFEEVCARLQGAWNHLAVVLDNSDPAQWKVVVYVNAEYVAERDISVPEDNSGSVFVGTRPVRNNNGERRDFFNGRLHLLLFSYDIASQNELNCAIGCGVALISTLEDTPLTYRYDYTARALRFEGRHPVSVYEEFVNSLALVLPFLEPISSSYNVDFTVQDDQFNCLPSDLDIVLSPSNDFIPSLSLTNDPNATIFTTVFVEEAGPVPALDTTGFSLTDGDLVAFVYTITVEILDHQPAGSQEVLSVVNVPSEMNQSFANYTLTLTGNLILPMFERVLRTIRYDNLDDEPEGDSRTLQFTVFDSPEEVSASSRIEIVLVNDVPILDFTFSLSEYSEGDGAVEFIEVVAIDDSDNATLVSGQISFNVQDFGAEILRVNTSGTNIVASYDSMAGVLNLTGEDTLEQYSAVLQSLSYEHTDMSDPSLGTRVFYITVSDGLADSSDANPAAMLFFSAVNDPPVLDLNGTAERGFSNYVLFVEDVDALVSVAPQAVIVDVDNTNLVNISITLMPVLDATEALVMDIPEGSGLNATTLTNSEIVLASLNPRPVEEYQSVIRNLRYQNLEEEPTRGDRMVVFTAHDGMDASIPAVSTISVRSSNDRPILDIDATSPEPGYETSFTENSPPLPVFITARNVSIMDNDVDANVSMVLVTISNQMDGLDEQIISTDTSVIITRGGSSFTIVPSDGSLSAVEDLLTTLQYVNRRAEPTGGVRTISVSVSDGASFSNSELVSLQVLSVNEHPPMFQQSRYSRSVLEEQPANSTVGAAVRAVDQDSGTDGVLSYAIVSADPAEGVNRFRIDDSGLIYTTEPLDREEVDFYVLNISASDPGMLSDLATVEVMVMDVSDQVPTFEPGSSSNFTVLENSAVGTTITTLVAVDGDLGENARVTFSLVQSSSPSLAVTSDGRVLVVGGLDADVPNPVHMISVMVTDNGTTPLSSVGNFTITVLDVNDNSPVFEEERYSGDLLENSPPGTSILTVVATDADSGTNSEITYILRTLTDPPRASQYFTIDAQTGVISNLVAFDFDQPLPTGCCGSFFLTAVDNGIPRRSNTGFVTVSIGITDANDNPPRFDTDSYSATIDENITVGSFVLQVNATDTDAGRNSDIRYSIVSNPQVEPLFASGPLFVINATTGVITVNMPVDYELQPLVNFTVEAQDMGSPAPLTGSAEVVVNIRDLNDNPPTFNQTVYEVSVPEDVDIGTTVLTVLATDPDSDESGAISYTLTDNTGTFAINQNGDLTNLVSLDFESDCFYQLAVTASDGETNVTAVINVIILSVHDVPPNFTMSSYARSVPENQNIGTSILQVSATDSDITSCFELALTGSGFGSGDMLGPTTDAPEPQQANFEYILLNHNYEFAIDPQTGLITNRIVLNHENVSQYELNVQARDLEGLTANTTATITVLDLNDNFPQFTQKLYTMVISENTEIGTTILRIMANDADSIDRGRLVYSLRDRLEYFSIDNRTGDIYVSGPIDFEDPDVGATLDLVAMVTDSANQSTVTLVQITITNLNDVPPFISTLPVTLTFTEGDVSLRPFPEITITDEDSFQMLCSAVVQLSTPEEEVDIEVTECECADVSFASSCTQECSEFLQLSSNAFPGTATQSDNATTLTLSGNHSIQEYVSAIQSLQYINIISNPLPESRSISIRVSDCVLPSNTLINTINVIAFNVYAPEVDLNGPSAPGTNFSTVFSEQGPQIPIAADDATITDRDMVSERQELSGLDVWISNPLDEGSEVLTVSPFFSHPNITLVSNSPYSISFVGVALISDYVSVLAQVFYDNEQDEPTPSPARLVTVVAHQFHLSSEPAVTEVTIESSNDHPPVILASPPRENRVTSYREGSEGVPLVLPNAVVSDMDASVDPVAGLQVYVVSPGVYDRIYLNGSLDIPDSISVNASSNSSLEFSGLAPPSYYELIIQGLIYQFTGDEFDSIFPPKFVYLGITDSLYSTFSAVQISLTPVNDQVPVFTQDTYSVEILENATMGEAVVQVTATDGDRFSNNVLRYSITAGNEDGLFAISPESGSIYLNMQLDREMTAVHHLVVSVVDLNYELVPVPPPSAAIVMVTVRDVNDLVPMLSEEAYNATVHESVAIGTVVLQVFASDADTDVHSDLEFELVGTSDFTIDADGVISTSAEIDRESVALYLFSVRVRNPGIAASDSASVTVTVLDIPDTPPILVLEPDSGVLREPETSIPLAINLTITDLDPNPSLDYAIVEIINASGNASDALGELVAMVSSDVIEISGNGTSMIVLTGESRPLYEYISVLRGVVYQDLSAEPADMSREVAYQVGSDPLPGQPLELGDSDGEMISDIATFTVTVRLLNDNPPQLSLDQRAQNMADLVLSACEGVSGSYSTEFAEDSSPIPISHSSLQITDPDNGENMIDFAIVEILDAQDGGQERLSVNLTNSEGAVSVSVGDSDDLRIVLTGPAPLQEFESALRLVM